jgi:glycosyltransferase involved in cell wall biosynthesis
MCYLRNVPRVSVVLPFNRLDPFLIPAIQSVVDNRSVDFDLLLIADGLNLDVVREFLSNVSDKRVRILANTGHGLVEALNTGIRESSSEFIARMDGDDLCHPERLANQANYLTNNSKVVVVGSNVRFICEHGTPLGSSTFKGKVGKWLLSQPLTSPVAHPSVMIRKSVLESVGLYRSLFVGFQAEDLDLWNRILRSGQIRNLRGTFLSYRLHKNQVSTTRSKEVALSSIAAAVWNIHEIYASSEPGKIPWLTDPEEMVKFLTSNQRLKSLKLVGRLRIWYILSYNGALLALNTARSALTPGRTHALASSTSKFSQFNLGSVLILPLIVVHHVGGLINLLTQRRHGCPHCPRT